MEDGKRGGSGVGSPGPFHMMYISAQIWAVLEMQNVLPPTLDVTYPEPPTADSVLYDMENVLLESVA
jgi:hypothetical protein